MIEITKEIGLYIYRFITHRILWLFVLTVVLFGSIMMQLFELQIVLADSFIPPPPITHEVTISTPALRGTIYDRHGRPLAVNRLVFVVKMDPSLGRVITNEALFELSLLFEQNDEDYISSFPINFDPFEFDAALVPNANQEFRWKDDLAIPNARYATAEESFLYLREFFDIDPDMSNEDAKRILNLRTMIFRERLIHLEHYNPMPILLAVDVSQETIAAIAEQSSLFAGVFVDIQATREYPAGIYMSHIIGYFRQITAEDLAANEHLGYTQSCMFGRQGLERSQEHFLRGTPGLQSFEINRMGTRISEPVIIQEALPGDRLFLTIDLELQMQAYYMLKQYLTDVLVRRMNLNDSRERAVTPHEVFISYVNGHNLDVRTVLAAEEGHALPMQRYILQRFPNPTNSREDIEQINDIIIEGIRTNRISIAKMLLTLIGTEQISDPDGTIAEQLTSRPQTARSVLIQKIEEWEITPQQVNMDPSTASVVILDVATGAVLAAASYPSYDNNRIANNMDVAYFNHIYFLDPTYPILPRAFREPLAPGSNFKMITAVAGLEGGSITPTTRITDRVVFTRAGNPPFRCFASGGHGNINVSQAIAVSCNYFFAETSWQLGAGTDNRTINGIGIMNEYMKHFGLHERSGVEILELFDQAGFDGYRISSPDFKQFSVLQGNPNASVGDQRWFDGDTVRTSIGQGFNAYTTAQMARAMNVFANRGVNYPLHLISHIENSQGQMVFRTEPEPVCRGLEFNESTWDAVSQGMRWVTQSGAGGTAVSLFRGFPIEIAGKTSTTQQIRNRLNHTAFGAYAPANDPQISIYVNVPFSATRAYTQLAARIARDMIGVALGLELDAEHPEPVNTLRP